MVFQATCSNRSSAKAKPSGSMMKGTQRGIGKSWASMPMV